MNISVARINLLLCVWRKQCARFKQMRFGIIDIFQSDYPHILCGMRLRMSIEWRWPRCQHTHTHTATGISQLLLVLRVIVSLINRIRRAQNWNRTSNEKQDTYIKFICAKCTGIVWSRHSSRIFFCQLARSIWVRSAQKTPETSQHYNFHLFICIESIKI